STASWPGWRPRGRSGTRWSTWPTRSGPGRGCEVPAVRDARGPGRLLLRSLRPPPRFPRLRVLRRFRRGRRGLLRTLRRTPDHRQGPRRDRPRRLRRRRRDGPGSAPGPQRRRHGHDAPRTPRRRPDHPVRTDHDPRGRGGPPERDARHVRRGGGGRRGALGRGGELAQGRGRVRRRAPSPDDAPACTYVAAVARPGEVTICWAGDTRAYWLADVAAPGGGVRREGMLLTEDDSAPTGEITAWLGADYPDVRPRIR